MTFLYNVAFVLLALASLPHFLLRLRQADRPGRLLAERLGFFSKDWQLRLLGKRVLWLHAVSVGEVLAMQAFLARLLNLRPEIHVVLTTVTPTGQRIAKGMEGERVSACYFPFDWTPVVRNFFKVLAPRCLLLAETEIWPNLLKEAARSRVPVGILNARLSARSWRCYRRFPYFFRPLFGQLDFVLAQTAEDAQRFVSLGVEPHRVKVVGNMKFDNVPLAPPRKASLPSLRREWGFDADDQILIAGSTHAGEEEMLLGVFERLRPNHPLFKMVVAPRHIERSNELLRRFAKGGLAVRLATEFVGRGKIDVLILNQMGVLKDLYAMADVVFMGGSLVPRGGQNPIEPAVFKRAILHGPYVFNFEKIYQLFDQEGAALRVGDEAQLAFALKRLLENESERTRLGENASVLVRGLQGATDRALEHLFDFLAPPTDLERIQDVEFSAKLFPRVGGRT